MNLIKALAEVCHEVNAAYCRGIGDDSQKSWHDAPDWQKASAEMGVKALLESNLSAEQMHSLWWEQKRRTGWTHGAVKDEVEKTHPCMVPYEDLDLKDQVKDHLFRAVVRTIQRQNG